MVLAALGRRGRIEVEVGISKEGKVEPNITIVSGDPKLGPQL